MKNVLLQAAIKLNKSRKQRKWWQNAVRAMTMVVVFCTTYALILPAITMEEEPICGVEAHTHEDACYVLKTDYLFQCALEPHSLVIHSHDELCYDADGALICMLPEIYAHTHGEECFGEESTLVCELEEAQPHVHDETCHSEELVLSCTLPEAELHTHGEECYAQPEISCGLEESEEHTHDETCRPGEPVLICTVVQEEAHTHGEECYTLVAVDCGLEETEGHIHEEACYEPIQVTVCQLLEVIPHVHDEICTGEPACLQPVVISHVHEEACRVETEPVQQLVCQLEEHIHEESCYPLEESQESQSEFLCGLGVHTHVETCFNEAGELTCTIPEHAHEAACIVEGLDLTADVESSEQWERMRGQLTLTGNWPRDVVAMASSQLGYQESVKNVILEDDQLKGYTRYGDWYGIPYGDWCAMFVSFCLDYAGVEEFPLNCEVNNWIAALTEQELYFTSDVYAPKPGDVIFFDYENVKDAPEDYIIRADHVGLVAELIPATEEEPAKIRTIEGNLNDQVMYGTYDLDNPILIGYGALPIGETIILEYQGEDFFITVSLDREAGIPQTAQLSVREILPGTEEYDTYYQQSVAALMSQNENVTEEELQVSFARFFDISFLVDGVAVEPATPAEIQIRYNESFAVEEGNTGVVVHFAEDGAEVLDADTNNSESGEADTFDFTQGSFSVSGTLVTAEPRAAAKVAYRVNFDELDGTGSTEYIIYTYYNNRYYAIGAPASGKLGQLVEVQVGADGTVTWTSNASIRWSFSSTGTNTYDITNENGRFLHPFYNGNGSDVGVIGTNSRGAALVGSGQGADATFKIKHPSNEVYVAISNNQFQPVTNAGRGLNFYLAAVRPSTYHVWFDGTDGGMMSYYGAENTYLAVDPDDNTITLPTTFGSSTKYNYTLRGWYDIKTSTYYAPGAEVTINQHTVFYADWIAATYDVGQNNEHVVNSLDTNDFITTYVFDYNALFNVLSQSHTGSVTANGHSESWTVYNNGETVPYQNGKSLGFVFVDYDANGEFSYAYGRDNTNTNQGDAITPGILNEVRNASGQDLLDLLFNPGTDVIGKYYAGTGNYLFQYMDSTTANYDGVHDGYYYLDARLNAASYNQSAQRFYLYNYLERTSDSSKDGGVGQYSDILPFNSPYIFGEDDDYTGQSNDSRRVDYYVDPINRPGWEYDAKEGGNNHPEYNSLTDATTNYFFGLRTDIEFFLPNDSGDQDEYGNYGNISTRGEHMIFDFHGDDDVWVFIDGELVLDIGGLHGVMFGQIDFSTGTVISGKDGGNTTTRTFQEILGHNITEGTHNMTVYYMERGSSQSNCAIYFNIAPRYDLEITKEDIVTADKLDGAVFAIYNDEAMTQPAQLWHSQDAHKADMADGEINNATNEFTVVNGVAKCWGISAGKTYYIFEKTPPPGYPQSDDMIRITLNNRGTATIETTTLHGANGVATEGFAVIKQEVNDTLKIVALTVTNQMEGDTTEIRVEKTWAAGSTNLPKSITVYLTADGVPIGRRAVLSEANGWAYTWTGLPKYTQDGIDQEIIYEVQEVLVPDYITTQGDSQKVENYVDWIRVEQMSDSKTYLLVHNGQALTYDGVSFGWMDPAAAEADTSLSAQWSVTTDHDGFHLKNGLHYTLTFNPATSSFYGVDNDAVELNQVFYFLNSRLVVHDHDVYYQFGSNGTAVAEDGLAFTLYQKEVLTGFLTGITNVPVADEDQTFVEVTKVWNENDPDQPSSVTIRLYADGKDTGRFVVLSAENNWTGGFYDLPYYREDNQTVIVYTVVEDEINNYNATYSAPEALPGLPVVLWQDADSLADNGIYRFTSGSYALAVNSQGDVTSAQSDLNDTYQQWKVINTGWTTILQNVGSGTYLVRSNTSLSTSSNQSRASQVTISNGYVMVGQMYLEIKANYAGATSNVANVGDLAVTLRVDTTGREGIHYTVTNSLSYTLPNTGGMGTLHLTFGGALIVSAGLMYICITGRKRRKGAM